MNNGESRRFYVIREIINLLGEREREMTISNIKIMLKPVLFTAGMDERAYDIDSQIRYLANEGFLIVTGNSAGLIEKGIEAYKTPGGFIAFMGKEARKRKKIS